MSEATDIVVFSRGVLARHARSFRWASKFLAHDRRDDAAVVYAFCRLVDDLADEAPDRERAGKQLDLVEAELDGRIPARPIVAAFVDVASRRSIDVSTAKELIAGVRSDLGTVCMQTDGELLRYCYRVAGTVGLMMCGILGVHEREAFPHAIDLGVAMQLTNICRDVLEDARRGRSYLPSSRLASVGVDPGELASTSVDRHAVASVVRDLLELADEYYASADYGMRFITPRSRLAIVVASRLYRGIGVKLRRDYDSDALHGRTWVSPVGKFVLVGTSLAHFLRPRVIGVERQLHNHHLHAPLRGLPGVSR